MDAFPPADAESDPFRDVAEPKIILDVEEHEFIGFIMKYLISYSVFVIIFITSILPVQGQIQQVMDLDDMLDQANLMENAGDCQGAYEKYDEMQLYLETETIADKRARSNLKAIITNKFNSLQECYNACSPDEEERLMFEKASQYYEQGQDRRAVVIVKRLLTGKDTRCRFYQEVKGFLGQIAPEEVDQIPADLDPCLGADDAEQEITELEKQLAKVKKVAARGKKRSKSGQYRQIHRLLRSFWQLENLQEKIFALREQFLDCDKVYNRLKSDSGTIKIVNQNLGKMIVSAYKYRVSGLKARLSKLSDSMKKKDGQIDNQQKQLSVLHNQLKNMQTFSEEVLSDLLALADINSIKMTTNVEGEEVELPTSMLEKVVSDQGQVLNILSSKFPEYFKDGVNREGLKRHRLVLSRMAELMERFGEREPSQTMELNKTRQQVSATIAMVDNLLTQYKTEDSGKIGQTSDISSSTSILIWSLAALLLFLVVIVAFYYQHKKRQKISKWK